MKRTVATLLLLGAACSPSAPAVTLATTTSVANSGLLDYLVSAYPDTVRVLQSGSGRALTMLEQGTADVVISHAPAKEGEMLRAHPSWVYRKVLYNDFLIVGPPTDRAGIAGMTDAVDAVRRISASGQRFLSRGDESGTHERERELWRAAGVTPPPEQLIVAGAGMGQTLRIASETATYTLTDRGTWEALQQAVQLRVLVQGDPRLLNTYAVLADSANARGLSFAQWLADGDGRRVLSNTIGSGQVRGFTVWPAGRDGTRPEARPF